MMTTEKNGKATNINTAYKRGTIPVEIASAVNTGKDMRIMIISYLMK
jgi:hypothetical protein